MNIKVKKQDGLSFKGIWTFTVRDKDGKIKSKHTYENLIPTIGRAEMAKALVGSLSAIAEIEINKTSLGSGTTAPANGDIKLETEVFRKTIFSRTSSSNQLFLTAAYSAGEAIGTHREAGLHINGTGVADSGVLFSRVAINEVVTATDTLTVDYTITITSS